MYLIIYLIIGLFFLAFGLINYYIGLRGWQYLGQYIPPLNQKIYWLGFWCVALSYLAVRFTGGFLPSGLRYLVTLIGAYWLAAMFYLIQFIILIDLLRIIDRWLHFIPETWKVDPRFGLKLGVLVLSVVTLLLVYGTWNAHNPRVKHYELNIPKRAGSLQQLHIVMASDIHLGEIMHNGRLVKLVELVKSLDPDILLLPGDIIDEDIGPFVQQDMAATFQGIHPRYGIFAVPGNHEYIRGHIDSAVYYLEQAGIKVLRDEYVKINDSIYIVGRDDITQVRFSVGTEQKELAKILEGVDKSLPIILLNHQPHQLEEAAQMGVDLQLSGHTHRGQLFPNNFITQAIFEIDWGYLRKGDLQLIVSTGFGTWGPPIRIGNRPEIVDIQLKFLP